MLRPTEQQVQSGTDGQGMGRWTPQHHGHSQPGAGLLFRWDDTPGVGVLAPSGGC